MFRKSERKALLSAAKQKGGQNQKKVWADIEEPREMTSDELEEVKSSIVGQVMMPHLQGRMPELEAVDYAAKFDEPEAEDKLESLGARIGRMQDGRLPLQEAQRLGMND